MKILLPTNDYKPAHGGVARYLYALKQTFLDQIDILIYKKFPNSILLFFSILFKMRKYDELWTSHILPVGTIAWLTAKINRKPYVIILHGMDFDLARRNLWKRFLSKMILRNAKRVVANTQALSKEVLDFVKIKKPLVVYPVVSDSMVEMSSFISSKKYENIQLLTVGRLVERKGHLDVIDAIKDLKNIHYTIVGDGEMRSKILDRIEELNIGDRVEIIQSVSDRKLPQVYARSDIFVMPAKKTKIDREGFGIVYLEAQLFGIPVIAMNTPGVDEAVEGGVLINQTSELRNAIIKLAENNDSRLLMGKKGREFVLDNFTREIQFSKFNELI